MQSTPIPISKYMGSNSEFATHNEFNFNGAYDNTSYNHLYNNEHRCLSYPCYFCNSNMYKNKSYSSIFSRSYICVDKRLTVLSNSLSSSQGEEEEEEQEQEQETETFLDGSFQVLPKEKQDDDSEEYMMNPLVPYKDDDTDSNSGTIEHSKSNDNIEEMNMDMIYESIDELPVSVFEDIAQDLLDNQC